MLAVLLVLVAVLGFTAPSDAASREYFIAAEPTLWDFAPSGRDLAHGGAIPKPWTQHTRWRKLRYVEYTRGFTAPKPQPPWLGVLGPIIRAEVGDTVIVHFRNLTGSPVGMHPHGLRYTKDSEGAHYEPAGAGAAIPPGGGFTYTWVADEDGGPGPADPSSIVWWYHSHVDEPGETNAGLLGPIIVTRAGAASADATPRDVDAEFVLLFMIFDEAGGAEHGLMHGINGYIFGNLPGLEVANGARVRWHVLGMGNEVDLHTAHWHGKTLTVRRRRTDVIELLPGSMATADMRADNPGTWMLHCHVADHIHAGMMATYTIRP